MINPEVRDIGMDRNVGSCVLFCYEISVRSCRWQIR